MSVQPLNIIRTFVKEGIKGIINRGSKVKHSTVVINDDSLYGEGLKQSSDEIKDMLSTLNEKIDNIETNGTANGMVNGTVKTNKAIEVEVQRQINVESADESSIESDSFENKTESKVDKLRKLRGIRNGS